MKRRRLKSRIKTLIISVLFLIFAIEIYILKQNIEMNNAYELISKIDTSKIEEIQYHQTIPSNEGKEIKTNDEQEQINLNIYIINDANADQKFMNMVEEQIQLIPAEIIQSFFNNDGIIDITNEDIKNLLINPDKEIIKDTSIVLGLYKRGDDIIFIRYHELTTERYAIVHEFGHYADKYYGWISEEKEWKQICKEEKDIIVSNVGIFNEKEIFAEIFTDIMVGREDNKDTQAYQYVKRIIETNN